MHGLHHTFHHTFRRALSRPLRSLLMLLQTLIGALAMTFALSMLLETPSNRKDVPLERFDLIAGKERAEGGTETYPLFRPEHLEELLQRVPELEALAFSGRVSSPQLEHDGRRLGFRLAHAVSPEYFAFEGLSAARGTFFSKGDERDRAEVVVISENAARILFGDADPIGQELFLRASTQDERTVTAAARPYRISGTVANSDEDAPSLLLPYWLHDLVQPISPSLSALARTGQRAAAEEGLLMAARQRYAEDLARAARAPGQDFLVSEPKVRAYLPDGYVDPNIIIFGLFGLVALAVGSIGIFSATVVDVVERRHEIGIRRALGASGARIGGTFMLEAATLAGVGAVAGIVLAAALMRVLEAQLRTLGLLSGSLSWQPLAALMVLGLVLFLAAVLGLLPALAAVRERPVAALKEA